MLRGPPGHACADCLRHGIPYSPLRACSQDRGKEKLLTQKVGIVKKFSACSLFRGGKLDNSAKTLSNSERWRSGGDWSEKQHSISALDAGGSAGDASPSVWTTIG